MSLFQLRMQQIPIVHPHVKDIGERREQIGPRRIEGNDAVVGIKQNKAVRDGIQPIPKRRNFGAQRRLDFFRIVIGVGRRLHCNFRIQINSCTNSSAGKSQSAKNRTASAIFALHGKGFQDTKHHAFETM